MDKKLYRSAKDKMIGGVAGGLAEYFDIDPTIIRVLFVVSLFLGGTGVIAYIVLWIIVPERPLVYNMGTTTEPHNTGPMEGRPADTNASAPDPVAAYQESINRRKQKRSFIGGIVLISLGVIFLADEFFPRISFEELFSAALIIFGVVLLLNSSKRS
jgi:phage shock protein PspC (stress-responsive transcriptional regulator)